MLYLIQFFFILIYKFIGTFYSIYIFFSSQRLYSFMTDYDYQPVHMIQCYIKDYFFGAKIRQTDLLNTR